MQWFYDITWRVAPDDPDMVEVERVYCLDYTQFSLPEVARIHALYADLPGWQGWHDQQPYWFGYDEGDVPYLWASLEPPGLQVAGVLRQADWMAWDSAFQARAQSLPRREF